MKVVSLQDFKSVTISIQGLFCLSDSPSLNTPWRRQWHPTPVLLPGKSHGWMSLVGCSPWGHYEPDAAEWLHFHFSLSRNGEGNGNPLQCSCLENPRDGEAWWVAVYGVTQSWTRLMRLSIILLLLSPWNCKLQGLKLPEDTLGVGNLDSLSYTLRRGRSRWGHKSHKSDQSSSVTSLENLIVLFLKVL